MGSSTGERAGPRPWARAAIIVLGAVVVSAVAIGGGLWLAGDDPEVPNDDDTHSAAPSCDVIPQDALTAALPGAALESTGQGPLQGGESTVCVWTTAGSTDVDQGVLRVDLSARFTDDSADPVITGDEAASQVYGAVTPVRGEPVDLAKGTEAQVWRGQLPGTAELAFHTANLLVRVSYTAETDGDPVSFDTARETAVDFASQLGEAL